MSFATSIECQLDATLLGGALPAYIGWRYYGFTNTRAFPHFFIVLAWPNHIPTPAIEIDERKAHYCFIMTWRYLGRRPKPDFRRAIFESEYITSSVGLSIGRIYIWSKDSISVEKAHPYLNPLFKGRVRGFRPIWKIHFRFRLQNSNSTAFLLSPSTLTETRAGPGLVWPQLSLSRKNFAKSR